ncbi:type II toxin-antitoxin system Phd/YefM family antitoxin [Kineococcus sp. SYSU DK001]|uniref:type II toxin-antitoxin system Phd/YefM family antitoxin n=1 Tax=Kineococcus sp. SYSU DK001 TaxID=3383122 RepID=UPI003D7E04ED
MRTISQRELRNDSGQVLRALRDGEHLLVTSNGVPVGVLRMDPPPAQPQRFVSAADMRQVFADLPPLSEEERERWKQDTRDAWGADEADDPWERDRR